MCRFSLPPGYTRTKPVGKPKLGALLPVIDEILASDQAGPLKQRHSAKRIFERLRDEHGFGGGYTVVKDYVRICRSRGRETFVPLAHPPGHAQVDFGEAIAIIGGLRQKIHFFCMDIPQSDACFVKPCPRETTEAFLDGHVSAFAFFDGVPLSILYDNLKIAVAKIGGNGKRERTRAFTELVSHHLFRDRFGRPAKGNDKGHDLKNADGSWYSAGQCLDFSRAFAEKVKSERSATRPAPKPAAPKGGQLIPVAVKVTGKSYTLADFGPPTS